MCVCESLYSVPLGNKRYKIAGGLVELSWYLPSTGDKNMFVYPTMIFNLRGDAVHFPMQVEFIKKVSSCVVISVNKDEVKSDAFRSVLQQVNPSDGEEIVLINSRPGPTGEDGEEADEIVDYGLPCDTILTYESTEDGIETINEDELKGTIRGQIKQLLHLKPKKTLTKAIEFAKELNVKPDNHKMLEIIDCVNKVSKTLTEDFLSTSKADCFILQQLWEKVNQLQKDLSNLPHQQDQGDHLTKENELRDVNKKQVQTLLEYSSRPLINAIIKGIYELSKFENKRDASASLLDL